MDDSSATDIQVGACRYLLHMLLQRLEGVHPGLVEEMLCGARGDLAAIAAQGHATDVPREAVSWLEMVHAHNQMAAGS